MTVKKIYEKDISLDRVLELAEDSTYWNSCYNFLGKVWGKDINSLTKKQINWLDKMVRSLNDEVFGY